MSRRSRAKQTQKPPAQEQEFHDEDDIGDDEADADELDEEQEITRCVCGNDELLPNAINHLLQSLLQSEYQIKIDQGLFIQCDKCSVWQHGYCVGLFINDDVPDKYWCEQCRPENHVEIVDEDRTLYKSVNEKRKILMTWNLEKKPRSGKRSTGSSAASSATSKDPGSNSTHNSSSGSNSKDSKDNKDNHSSTGTTSDHSRKDRRAVAADAYDEQLEKALRESARESGVTLGDDSSGSSTLSRKKRVKEEGPAEQIKNASPVKRRRGGATSGGDESAAEDVSSRSSKSRRNGASSSPDIKGDADEGEDEDEGDEEDEVEESESHPSTAPATSKGASSAPTSASSNTTTLLAGGGKKAKGARTKKAALTAKNGSGSHGSNNTPAPTKEELTNQPSKPRFVNTKSSIYELRKRTGAILEWLGRSQLELEEEKLSKIELFLYHEGGKEEQSKITNNYDFNLKKMEELTEKILNWEQRFGKYAP